MMTTLIVALFIIGYLLIALEHPIKVDKAATAIITGVALWIAYAFSSTELVPSLYPEQLAAFLSANPSQATAPMMAQVMAFVHEHQIVTELGEISEILFFLIGAMTIVELIDVHGGFNIITNRITTKEKRKLLWIIGFITFFMSAVLDNLTTAIVMITLLRKLIANYKERWLYAGIIIIAANCGGAWSPIGDVTTIMLWVKGNVTASGLIPSLFFPCLVAFLIPTFFVTRWLGGTVTAPAPRHANLQSNTATTHSNVTRKERLSIFVLGVCCLLFVPVFKSITHLPPFMGILFSLGVMWVYTEMMYKRKKSNPEMPQARVSTVLKRIDIPTILFFLGILLAVSALKMSGILGYVSTWLDTNIHNVYIINVLIGLLSSVVDNVPLVAGSIASYPLLDAASVASAADPAYAAAFVQDGLFWEFLAYCAGIGGSILIIGSAAGVVVMGLEKMNFVWYLKNISLITLVGYLAGAAVYIIEKVFIF